MTSDESPYQEVVISAGNVIACVAVVGSQIDSDERFAEIREAWYEKIEEVITKLDRLVEEVTLFGEAYEG